MSFIEFNKKISKAIGTVFPNTKFDIFAHYLDLVKGKLREEQVIVDIGGGKRCKFSSERKGYKNNRIIAIDVSDEELRFNDDVDEKIVADVTKSIPLKDSSVDMVTSESVLEHLQDLELTVKEISRILSKGGYFISLFPNKFALFAIINQCLPNSISKKILYRLHPESRGIGGFKAYYNRCFFRSLNKLLVANGFEDIKYYFSYNQSSYFSFFVPFYVISLLWDYMMYLFHAKNMCAYVCFVAKGREGKGREGKGNKLRYNRGDYNICEDK
jgi:ubiquinone/menaquinone biosynthesis C-methylase UbiE